MASTIRAGEADPDRRGQAQGFSPHATAARSQFSSDLSCPVHQERTSPEEGKNRVERFPRGEPLCQGATLSRRLGRPARWRLAARDSPLTPNSPSSPQPESRGYLHGTSALCRARSAKCGRGCDCTIMTRSRPFASEQEGTFKETSGETLRTLGLVAGDISLA